MLVGSSWYIGQKGMSTRGAPNNLRQAAEAEY